MDREEIDYNSQTESMKAFLASRDIYDEEGFRRFVYPEFENLKKSEDSTDEILDKLFMHLEKNNRIMIWADEDMDGITSLLVLKRALERETTTTVHEYIPSRRIEGYGLSEEGIDLAERMKIDLIITVDCGITSLEEIDYGRRKGIDFIITDHHEPGEILPDITFLNPKVGNWGYRYLAGAGVALKFVNSILKKVGFKSTRQWADKIPEIPVWAMIGTIGDKVPRLDENRIVMREGRRYLNKTENPALAFLSEKEDIEKAISPLHSGRKGLTLEFFKETDRSRIHEIYSELKSYHDVWNDRARQSFVKLKERLDEGKLVIVEEDMDPEVGGSVAGRSRDYTNKPVFIILKDKNKIRGEGRGPGDFDLLSALGEVSDLLIDYGGHKPACGFRLKPGKIEEFRRRVQPILGEYERTIRVDATLKLEEINDELIKIVDLMKPYGIGNPPPIFRVNDVAYRYTNGVPVLYSCESMLTLDGAREMPPPSEKVNAYLKVKDSRVMLLSWEWND